MRIQRIANEAIVSRALLVLTFPLSCLYRSMVLTSDVHLYLCVDLREVKPSISLFQSDETFPPSQPSPPIRPAHPSILDQSAESGLSGLIPPLTSTSRMLSSSSSQLDSPSTSLNTAPAKHKARKISSCKPPLQSLSFLWQRELTLISLSPPLFPTPACIRQPLQSLKTTL